MRGGVGDERAEYGRIDHQHGPGDAGHAAGHHHEQLAAREAREVGADEERSLDHAEKDVGRGRQADGAPDLERAFEQPGKAAHDRRQDAPVKQQRREHAHEQDDRQGLQREHELGARHLEIVGQLAAAEIAEDEGGAGSAGGGDRTDGVVDRAEGAGDAGHLEQDERGQECEQEANGNRSPRHGTAVFADDPGEGDKRKDAQQRLKMLHCLAVSVGRGWSGAPLLRRRHGLRGQAPSRHGLVSRFRRSYHLAGRTFTNVGNKGTLASL